ncbi:hypoxanthine-guanine phosphoribosyltransferase [Allohahella sp. A8]|uniref:hypoxanthine-guanine phosphoribosyltransferase n=1 Tax=Allohahella sp. A8 TaxID=3141461 RepID=UPI003A7FE9EA
MTDIEHFMAIRQRAECLFTFEETEQAIARVAAQMTHQLAASNPLLMTVMTGAVVFVGRLVGHLDFPLEISYLHATRYRNTTTGNSLQWKVPPQQDVKERTVVVIDDILDEGHTLAEVERHLHELGATAVYTAVLVDKRHERKAYPGQRCHFTGLEVPDRYVFGSGMDYRGYWRNTGGIHAVHPDDL